MKRIWTNAEITGQPGTYILTLDGKPPHLPSGTLPHIPFRPLALALLQEWQHAPAEFSPDDLPLTRLAVTAASRVALHKPDICRQLAAYGLADLLCYRAPESALAAEQKAAWQPWLNWAANRHGVALNIVTGLMPADQPAAAGPIFEATLAAMTVHDLAALGVIVPALGSLILGLAVQAGALPAPAACRLSWLDELWQETRWGTDSEALKRRHLVEQDVSLSARFMELCQP